jgi:excisionase family DNA binding protein
MTSDRIMNTLEAARYLGLSKSTVEKMRHFGTGPRYYKLTHLCRYHAADLDSWMAERLIGSTSEKPGSSGR